jgi:hypothetical protein
VSAKIPSSAISAGARHEKDFRRGIRRSSRERIARPNSSLATKSELKEEGRQPFHPRHCAAGMCFTRMPFLDRTSAVPKFGLKMA